MARYILRRLALAIPLLLAISLVVFLMLRTAGGDPAEVRLGQRADAESLAQVRKELGLDQPLAVQYLDFLEGAVRGDLGRSYRSNVEVTDEIWARFPATVELAVAAMAIATLIGVAAGIIAARNRNGFFDYSSTAGALMGVSIPTFWLGILLIVVFGLWLKWLPISGRVDPRLGTDPSESFLIVRSYLSGDVTAGNDALKHLILPAVTLAAWPAAITARMTRASLLEAMDQDYVRTARAKGLRDGIVVRRHALSNAVIPIVTVLGLEFGSLLGGAVVTETVFAWPGIGGLTVAAINARDYQIVQGVVLLLGVIFILLNLLVDLAYAALDPRIRYGR
jgi:ABC-type dipeptide/oligopeptide/nickel transport system permease component